MKTPKGKPNAKMSPLQHQPETHEDLEPVLVRTSDVHFYDKVPQKSKGGSTWCQFRKWQPMASWLLCGSTKAEGHCGVELPTSMSSWWPESSGHVTEKHMKGAHACAACSGDSPLPTSHQWVNNPQVKVRVPSWSNHFQSTSPSLPHWGTAFYTRVHWRTRRTPLIICRYNRPLTWRLWKKQNRFFFSN